MRNTLFIICIFIFFLGCSRKEETSTIDFEWIRNTYNKSFDDYPDYVDHYSYDGIYKDALAIENKLLVFLNSKDSLNVNVEEELPFIKVASSADGKIKTFSWDTKMGGSIRAITRIIQYVSGYVLYGIKIEEGWSEGAGVDNIYIFGDNMYLFSGITRIEFNRFTNIYYAIKIENDMIIPVDIPVYMVEYQGTMVQGSRQSLINFYINWLPNGEVYDASYQYAGYSESILLETRRIGEPYIGEFYLVGDFSRAFLFDDLSIDNKILTGKWFSIFLKYDDGDIYIENVYDVTLEKKDARW